MTTRHVIADWTAAYDDPISLEEGEEIWLTDKAENWGGHIWVWARNRDGKTGWIPDSLPRRVGTRTLAKTAYSARELTCRRGDVLQGIDETHGWVLCRNADGQVGWVPEENLGDTPES